jgi:hypothetical protein
MDVLSVVSVVCCQAEVPATGRSLVQRSPTGCGVSECDLETSTVRRPWATGAVEAWKKCIWNYIIYKIVLLFLNSFFVCKSFVEFLSFC